MRIVLETTQKWYIDVVVDVLYIVFAINLFYVDLTTFSKLVLFYKNSYLHLYSYNLYYRDLYQCVSSKFHVTISLLVLIVTIWKILRRWKDIRNDWFKIYSVFVNVTDQRFSNLVVRRKYNLLHILNWISIFQLI